MAMPSSNDSNTRQSIPYLSPLSALAARSYESTNELVDAVLSLVSDQLGLRTSFLTNITVTENRNRVVAAYNRPGGCGIMADSDLPLADTF